MEAFETAKLKWLMQPTNKQSIPWLRSTFIMTLQTYELLQWATRVMIWIELIQQRLMACQLDRWNNMQAHLKDETLSQPNGKIFPALLNYTRVQICYVCVHSLLIMCREQSWGLKMSQMKHFTVKQYTVKPICIQTLSTFLPLSQFICYSLENGNQIW